MKKLKHFLKVNRVATILIVIGLAFLFTKTQPYPDLGVTVLFGGVVLTIFGGKKCTNCCKDK